MLYRLQTQGRFADYLEFLRGFEACASWADIASLKLESHSARTPAGKSGELTVSLYSAIEEEAAAAAMPET